MKIITEFRPLSQIDTDALIVLVFEGLREERFGAAELTDTGEVTGKILELTTIHHASGVAARRIVLAGAGKAEKFDSAQLRRVGGAAFRFLKSKSAKSASDGWRRSECDCCIASVPS